MEQLIILRLKAVIHINSLKLHVEICIIITRCFQTIEDIKNVSVIW